MADPGISTVGANNTDNTYAAYAIDDEDVGTGVVASNDNNAQYDPNAYTGYDDTTYNNNPPQDGYYDDTGYYHDNNNNNNPGYDDNNHMTGGGDQYDPNAVNPLDGVGTYQGGHEDYATTDYGGGMSGGYYADGADTGVYHQDQQQQQQPNNNNNYYDRYDSGDYQQQEQHYDQYYPEQQQQQQEQQQQQPYERQASGSSRQPLTGTPQQSVTNPIRTGDTGNKPDDSFDGSQVPVRQPMSPASMMRAAVYTPRGGSRGIYNHHGKVSFLRWMGHVSKTLALSVPFKFYLMAHFYGAYVIALLVTLNTLYATMYRMYAPVDPDKGSFVQTLGYLTVLIVMHFFFGSVLTLIQEAAKEYWFTTEEDQYLWGINKHALPHGFVYFLLLFFYAVFPFFWAICHAVYETATVLFTVQIFFFVTLMTMMWQIVVMYVWLYIRSMGQKQRALRDRVKHFSMSPNVYNASNDAGGGIRKISWYQSPTVLKEYGMDVQSLISMMIYTFTGFVAHLAVSIAMALDGLEKSPEPGGWIGIGVCYIVCLWFIGEMALRKRWYRSAMMASMFVGLYFIVGLIGCALSGGAVITMFFILLVATQGLLLRKRDYYARDEPHLLGGARNSTPTTEENQRPPILDSYMCCCRTLLQMCFQGKRSLFGHRETPEMQDENRRIRRHRFSLWVDVKTLNNVLIFFTIVLILFLTWGRQLRSEFDTSMAAKGATAIGPSSGRPHTMCSWRAYRSAKAESTNDTKVRNPRLGIVDLALLSALGTVRGDFVEKDFNIWFGGTYSNTIVRRYPRAFPTRTTATTIRNNNEEEETRDNPEIGSSVNANFIDYFDTETSTHYIIMRGFVASTTWMRDLDLWWESMSYQIAGIAIPFVSSWPIKYQRDFVSSLGFIKEHYGGDNVTDIVEAYIRTNVIAKGHTCVITGAGSNGGLAKLVAARTHQYVVAFNSPGTLLMGAKFSVKEGQNREREMTINQERNLWGYVDIMSGSHFTLPCAMKGETECANVGPALINAVVAACGDEYGRSANAV
eukprot:PhM_4_TR13364/c6_g1_i1/m.64880